VFSHDGGSTIRLAVRQAEGLAPGPASAAAWYRRGPPYRLPRSRLRDTYRPRTRTILGPARYLQVSAVKILRHRIEFETVDPIQILDITDRIRNWVAGGDISDGLLTVISAHTTARVNVNEREPQLQRDMVTFLKRLVPRDGDYLHNLAPIDGRDNAHSHLLGLFMNTTETIPVANHELMLGQWQSIFFIELDGPRPRRGLDLQLLGNN
jgi:secondary thiamine-phosphate synthase enzyme